MPGALLYEAAQLAGASPCRPISAADGVGDAFLGEARLGGAGEFPVPCLLVTGSGRVLLAFGQEAGLGRPGQLLVGSLEVAALGLSGADGATKGKRDQQGPLHANLLSMGGGGYGIPARSETHGAFLPWFCRIL
ncbi:hypothetical protein BOSEA31B_14423 [Hyphomicrobiales bacterium]|nr:hypothetical protein BOSEA31B_14423 [Hyphomicrobiales bacterium]